MSYSRNRKRNRETAILAALAICTSAAAIVIGCSSLAMEHKALHSRDGFYYTQDFVYYRDGADFYRFKGQDWEPFPGGFEDFDSNYGNNYTWSPEPLT